MSRVPAFVLSLLLISGLNLAAKDKDKDKESPGGWLPITQQDLAVKEVPHDPGADAIQLYMSYYKDDDAKFISVYKRIKILRAGALEPGKKLVDVEIPIEPGQALKELAARTIHPDQKIIEFTGKPFEKVLIKTRGVKYSAMTFTCPDVTVGSIIEYRYKIGLPLGVVSTISAWPVQEDLFTVKEDLRFRAYQGVVSVPTEWTSIFPKSKVAYSYLNQIDLAVPEKKQPGNLMELQLQNVPKFDAEEYMPPEDDFRPVIFFYYGGREMSSPEGFWDEWQKLITEYVEKYIGNSREIYDAAVKTIAGETDPEKKLRKLYARAQQIRNLSFERERTSEEKKQEHLKRNFNVQGVLQRGYGSAWEVNVTFAALARAAGFEATMLGVSDRKDRSFNKIILWLGQLDASAVMVKLGSKDVTLDPGTRFCPFGGLRWEKTDTTALKYGKAGGGFITTPQPESALLHRTARMSLGVDGALSGELSVDFNGEEALAHRLDALDQDEAGRRKSLEDEVKGWLPQDAVVKLQEARGWETTDAPLNARFKIEVPGFASTAGKRMVSPSFFLSTLQKNIFTSQIRRYPVSFPYPFTEEDELTMKLPEGYGVEAPPYRRKAGLAYAGYEISSVVEDRQLITRRKLRFEGSLMPLEKYEELRNFFAVVQKGDGGQAVLRPESELKAQSQN
ncbi:MAG TPA: transglutaminase domain-containing protein [Candidatus Angelobacter sp.]|nr:transglutaminase domain-containing protein [Candidatus Angelobacter sp.]